MPAASGRTRSLPLAASAASSCFAMRCTPMTVGRNGNVPFVRGPLAQHLSVRPAAHMSDVKRENIRDRLHFAGPVTSVHLFSACANRWVACGLKQGLATLSDGGSVFCTPRSRLTLPLPLEEFKSPKQERPIAARFRRTAGTRRMFTCWSRRHESWQQCTAPCSARVSPWQSRCRTRTSTTASAAGWPAIS